MATQAIKVTLRVRISQSDLHYGGGLASGSKVMELFGDAATEVLIRHDGDEGLFRAYQEVEFLAPIKPGDFIEVTARLTRVGKTSREMNFEAYKIIDGARDPNNPSSAQLLPQPLLVAQAKGTCVVKKGA
ncbi:MAG: hotdog fold domain-containing protein [Deltaproteobacteria bacterium]|nr:hotdog fold domain-containing protein [Deltaproteobacteria bacterium]